MATAAAGAAGAVFWRKELIILILSYFVDAKTFPKTTKSSGPIELCQWNTFNETCPAGSVIVVEHALYGRMHLGRCVDRDYGHQGCSVSVLSYVERRCAGKRRCVLSLPDEYLDQLRIPCPKDLKSYLELSYHCAEVETGDPHECRGSDVRVTKPTGYLSNFITEETNRGSPTCPWVIEGRPGQRFALTLVDFAVWSKDGGGDDDGSRASLKTGLCQIYAKIREATESPAGGGGGVIVCGGERREQLVYTSDTNVVRVEITDPRSGPNPAYFLIKYEITGCANYVPHWSTAVAERHSDRTLVRCPHEDVTFELRCEVDQWIGRVQNCSDEWHGASFWNLGGVLARSGTIAKDIVAMAIGVIAVLVAFGILAIGILFIRRRRSDRHNQRLQKLMTGDDEVIGSRPGVTDNKLKSDPTYIRYKEHYPMLLKPHGFPATKGPLEGDYPATSSFDPRQPLTQTVHVTIGSSRLGHDDPPPANPTPDFYCFPGDGNFPAADQEDLYSISSGATGHRDDHIYESPKFFRRPCGGEDEGDARQGAFYHELDRGQTFAPRWTSAP